MNFIYSFFSPGSFLLKLMPTLEENIEYWNGKHPWDDEGREWSNAWGSPEVQWFGSIFPRIMEFMPSDHVLEIAPGYGRWTSFLLGNCKELSAIDVSGKCIDYCKKKFKHFPKAKFYKNDGEHLSMITSSSVDFVFCFDSFVHFNQHTTGQYLASISRTLKQGGIGFIHHSNLGSNYSYVPDHGWRSPDVSQLSFREACNDHGLACIRQEQITWGSNSEVLTDCLSLFKKTNKKILNAVIKNFDFIYEANWLKELSQNYEKDRHKSLGST